MGEGMMPNLLNAARGSDDNAGYLLLELLLLLLDGHSTEEVAYLHTPEPAAEALKLVANLRGEGESDASSQGGLRGRAARTWKASSRVWHRTIAETSPGLGSSC